MRGERGGYRESGSKTHGEGGSRNCEERENRKYLKMGELIWKRRGKVK